MTLTAWWLAGLCVVLGAALLAAVWLLFRSRQRLRYIDSVLADIAAGHPHRRALTHPGDPAERICYRLNEMAVQNRDQAALYRREQAAGRELMVNLSHDVRTPLTTLLGYLDAIHRGVVTGAERDACLEIARGKACELKQTVDDLFTWSKLQAGEESLSLQDCDLAELTRQRLKDWVPLWEESRLDYELELPEQRVAVRLDPDAYGRVLNNLVSNVLRHSRATRLVIRLLPGPGRTVALQVSDNGVGIAPEALPHLFDRLYRADPSRSGPGSGLGLDIARQLVERMGGRIEAESAPGAGATFRLFFPQSE